MTLNKIAKGIQKEHGYSRQYAYVLARKVISNMAEMDNEDEAYENRQEFMVRVGVRREWDDPLQDQVVWEV